MVAITYLPQFADSSYEKAYYMLMQLIPLIDSSAYLKALYYIEWKFAYCLVN